MTKRAMLYGIAIQENTESTIAYAVRYLKNLIISLILIQNYKNTILNQIGLDKFFLITFAI